MLEVVANGIEDMQLASACDLNHDQMLEEGESLSERHVDEWAFNVEGGSTPPDCTTSRMVNGELFHPHISMVRITLVARDMAADPTLKTGHRPGAEDRPPGTLSDDHAISGGKATFVRRRMTVKVRPRNL